MYYCMLKSSSSDRRRAHLNLAAFSMPGGAKKNSQALLFVVFGSLLHPPTRRQASSISARPHQMAKGQLISAMGEVSTEETALLSRGCPSIARHPNICLSVRVYITKRLLFLLCCAYEGEGCDRFAADTVAAATGVSRGRQPIFGSSPSRRPKLARAAGAHILIFGFPPRFGTENICPFPVKRASGVSRQGRAARYRQSELSYSKIMSCHPTRAVRR